MSGFMVSRSRISISDLRRRSQILQVTCSASTATRLWDELAISNGVPRDLEMMAGQKICACSLHHNKSEL
jgi:hypothetical protein